MNARRVAEIHKELAQLHLELADELAPDGEPTPEPERPKARTRVHPAPLHAPTDLDVQRARKMLRRRGMAT